jgi:hypothetical protein
MIRERHDDDLIDSAVTLPRFSGSQDLRRAGGSTRKREFNRRWPDRVWDGAAKRLGRYHP